MSILKLEVEGFRSFRTMTWEPGSLNVVIGPNACGKSNLLGLLEMLSEAAKGRLREYVLRQGGMTALLWDGRAQSLRVSLDVTPTIDPWGIRDIGRLKYSLDIPAFDFDPGNCVVLKEHLQEEVGDASEGKKYVQLMQCGPGKALVFTHNSPQGMELTSQRGNDALLLPWLGRDPGNYPEAYSLQSAVSAWRAYQYFSTSPDAPVRLAQVARFETELAPDGQNLTAFLHTLYESDGGFREQVNDAMNAAFGGDFEELVFPPAADQRVQMRIRWKGLKQAQSAAVLSDGTLRFLFLVAALANPKPPALIAIDEPETGLHPSMLPILAEYAVDAASRTQLVFTSHSPEFLNAFSDTIPTTTVMQWNDGQTEVRVLQGESLSYWLERYQLGELYRDRQLEAMG